MRFAERGRAVLARPRELVAAAVAVQWLTTLAAALQAEHDGWRWGDPGRAMDLLDGTGALAPIVLLNVVLLAPIAVLCAYRIAAAVGGAALGAWTLLVWIAAPWAMYAFTLAPYDATLRDRVLPLGLGLTPEPGYASGVALLVAAALLITSGSGPRCWSGIAVAIAILLTPEAVLFVAPAALALLTYRRPRAVAFFLSGVAPALLAAVFWREPSFRHLSLDRLQSHVAGLREYFWSQRLIQWLPFAGVIAIGRRSLSLAILLGGWFGAFLLGRATRPGVGFDDGELFRALLPALPAYVLLAASLPLLVPTLAARLGPLARPANS